MQIELWLKTVISCHDSAEVREQGEPRMPYARCAALIGELHTNLLHHRKWYLLVPFAQQLGHQALCLRQSHRQQIHLPPWDLLHTKIWFNFQILNFGMRGVPGKTNPTKGHWKTYLNFTFTCAHTTILTH